MPSFSVYANLVPRVSPLHVSGTRRGEKLGTRLGICPIIVQWRIWPVIFPEFGLIINQTKNPPRIRYNPFMFLVLQLYYVFFLLKKTSRHHLCVLTIDYCELPLIGSILANGLACVVSLLSYLDACRVCGVYQCC